MEIIRGSCTEAKSYADILENACRTQIQAMCDHPAFTGPIAIMPDAHAGTGAVIGFTMPLGEKLVPSVVGVDIGCGMLAVKIPGWSHEAHRDRLIREAVPMGFDTRDTPVAAVKDFREFYPSINAAILEFGRGLGVDAASLLTDDAVIDKLLQEHGGKRAWNSIGTLGGGNHFIEVDICEATQEFWLVIHTGSRNFGKQVCEAWPEPAPKNRRMRRSPPPDRPFSRPPRGESSPARKSGDALRR